MIFQDPFGALDPRMPIAHVIAEGMRGGLTEAEKWKKCEALLKTVGLPEDSLQRYPHEFSGGQRQRIGIARALAVEPDLMVCDEPTSALDLSIQAQILNVLQQLQQTQGLSYLLITHDIGVVSYLADEVAVMYLGRIVEKREGEVMFC